MDLLDMGFGLMEVCRILGWRENKITTLWEWKHGRHRPPITRWIPEPSEKLAYVLGVLIGDGYIVKEHLHNYDIEILVKDYDFAEAFSKALAKMLNKKIQKPIWSESHNR